MIYSPLLALAAAAKSTGGVTFYGLIIEIKKLLNALVPLLVGLAVVVFLYGMINYITAGGDEKKRTEGRDVIIYGIIGLFVMVAVWGLVNLILSTFTLEYDAPMYGIPSMPTD